MKNIVSFNFPIRDFTLEKLIDFYFICSSSDQNVYLYKDGKTCRIRRMTELIAFTLTSEEDCVLIVVEGEQAKRTMKHLIQSLYVNRRGIQVI
ncbi:phosphotransferase system HPr-like phosphotransfer protein [Pullulanibacillus pueri]|uniref:Uncharacterized protein n=1 Tax=Pullulanibacillus pueri TaxID=1437324 RepID=A0A8J2ZSA8_9BACL|nr:hypothetical protein [Pullulanibacillus pueri]MBM7680035.1 phosphotransferase system HPr-like phosphotransfer protein [Pullulanibacillus pueri]GGH74050.1 hypothetical protein GCM10007096_01890 [Pullulanibacillus pueri]